jgi:outer membrane protein TolC
MAGVALVVGSGCVLAPGAAKQEQAALARASASYAAPFRERQLPVIAAEPSWREVLERALYANGEVEAAYFEWAAAVHRIERAGAYPNTPLALDFGAAIRGGGKGFDRTSIGLGFDPMENLAFPTKVYQAAKVATDQAQAAGQRFVAVRLDVQRRVLAAWIDYALAAERLRVQREKAAWLGLLAETAAARVAAGESRQDQVRAESDRRRAESEAATLAATLPQLRAQLNAMIAREPEAPLAPPAALEGRPLPADDAALLALAAAHNPELAALAHEVRGRRDALELARLQYIPDFNPFVSTEGAATQVVGMVISIPTLLREVGGAIRESRADLRALLARYRQARYDRAAAVVAALYVVRNSERQAALFDGPLRGAADDVAASARVGYASNTGSYAELVAAQEALLDLRLLAAEARAAREKAVGDLEALVGIDAETLTALDAAPPASATATAASAEVGR